MKKNMPVKYAFLVLMACLLSLTSACGSLPSSPTSTAAIENDNSFGGEAGAIYGSSGLEEFFYPNKLVDKINQEHLQFDTITLKELGLDEIKMTEIVTMSSTEKSVRFYMPARYQHYIAWEILLTKNPADGTAIAKSWSKEMKWKI